MLLMNSKYIKLLNIVLFILLINYMEFYFIKKVNEYNNNTKIEDNISKNDDDTTKTQTNYINKISEDKATNMKTQIQAETEANNTIMDDTTQIHTQTNKPEQTPSSNSVEKNEKETSQLHLQAQTEEKLNGKTQNESNKITNTSTTTITSSSDEINHTTTEIKDEKNESNDEKKGNIIKDELSLKIDIIRKLLKESDSVLIGGGAGLSVAAGLDNAGLKFEENFKDFIDAYGFTDLYSGGFYPFSTIEEKWGYFSRNCVTYIDSKPTQLYKDLLKLVKDKDYFVLTTNVDDHFEKAGFDTKRIFATQGDFVNLQCSVPCHNKFIGP